MISNLKTLSILLLFSVIGTSMAWGQTYTNDATLVQKKKLSAVVKASGMHEKKKEATLMAVKSAFDTYFNYGIVGLNDDRPLISDAAAASSSAYLERFFDDKSKRYLSFVATYEEDKNPKKLPNNMYKATITLEIYTDALEKDLSRNNVKTSALSTVPKIQEVVYQPTIMVVPYKQQNKGYKEILREAGYVDLRNAITRVQDAFVKKGYSIKDVMAVLEATEKSMLLESNSSVESFDGHLINSSGSDVYVTVDAGHNTNDAGISGSIALVAYERASGKLLASKQANTQRYAKGTLTDVYRIAIGSIIDDFMKDITSSYAKKADLGNTFVLRVSTGNMATMDLNSEIASEGGYPLSDVLRKWLRQNALNGNFHVQGATRDLVIFDEIQVAAKTQDGHFQDANDFALNIFTFLKSLGIACDKRVDGNTIYITIEE